MIAMKDFSDIKNLFQNCHTLEERYEKIIELGRNLSPMSPEYKIEKNVVKGCQSIVYLYCECKDDKLYYQASSDALISSGLAALLIRAYNGESPETILQCKPTFLEDLHIYASLSPGRSNGLANMYLRMQKEAIKFLTRV